MDAFVRKAVTASNKDDSDIEVRLRSIRMAQAKPVEMPELADELEDERVEMEGVVVAVSVVVDVEEVVAVVACELLSANGATGDLRATKWSL